MRGDCMGSKAGKALLGPIGFLAERTPPRDPTEKLNELVAFFEEAI